MNRRAYLQGVVGGVALLASTFLPSSSALAFFTETSVKQRNIGVALDVPEKNTVVYKSMMLPLEEFGAKVPIACWFPSNAEEDLPTKVPVYDHRISVKRIGELLAGWDFIPEFASKDYRLDPTFASAVVDGRDLSLPSTGKVVILAHGYLGSRYDLSHLGEYLARQGFICLSPEYPESLAASYERIEGLDRSRITSELLKTLSSDWKVQASSYGIVGHSLGCGTAVKTGDSSWTRVCIAGFPRMPDGSPLKVGGPILFVSSVNDGAVSIARFGGKSAIPSQFVQLEESSLGDLERFPDKAALILDRPDAPNHISFLAESVNDSMINLLSPLLPVAQAFSIPVLDFDRYKESRDSQQTASVVVPLVAQYLQQNMQ